MIEVNKVSKEYTKSGSFFNTEKMLVVDEVSFTVKRGQCMGLVGESGSGKSTLSRLILGLEVPNRGQILIENQSSNLWVKNNKGKMSVVFQDYASSINPIYQVNEIISEPLSVSDNFDKSQSYILKLLEQVELSSKLLARYPHELSGGQLQRVCIARAIATKPKVLIFDEALSSLDVSVQAQILKLLIALKEEIDLTYLFIAHDLKAVTRLCDEILFMYQGKIVEQIATKNLYKTQNEYAKKLLEAAIYFQKNK